MANYRLIAKISQQTIAQTTHFFSTSPSFGVNTQFSEDLRNTFIINDLHSQPNIQRSTFNLSSCGWACFVVQNMPNGMTIHGFTRHERCLTATRSGIFRNGSSKRRRRKGVKTVFSFSISPGITDKLFDQMMRQFIPFPFRIDTRIASTSPSSNSQMAWPISRKQPITHLSSVPFGHMAYAR